MKYTLKSRPNSTGSTEKVLECPNITEYGRLVRPGGSVTFAQICPDLSQISGPFDILRCHIFNRSGKDLGWHEIAKTSINYNDIHNKMVGMIAIPQVVIPRQSMTKTA